VRKIANHSKKSSQVGKEGIHRNCTIAKHMNEQNLKTRITKIKELVIVKKTCHFLELVIKKLAKLKSLLKARGYKACKKSLKK
jgi:hypothetical protein